MTNNKSHPDKYISLKTGDIILTVLFFTSIGLTIWGINIYRLTIIETKYLFIAILLGLIITFITLTILVKSSHSTFWSIFIKAGIGIGLTFFGFLFLNHRFSDEDFLIEDFQIIDKGTLGGGKSSSCYQPYVVVEVYKTEKQLVFFCSDSEMVKNSTNVKLEFSKGMFGFYTIRSKQLLN